MDVREGLEALTRHQAVVAHVVVVLGGEVFAIPCGFLLLHAHACLHQRRDSVVVVIVVLGQEALEDIFLLRVLRVARRRGNSLLLPCARLLAARVVLWLLVRCECAVAIAAGTLEPSGADAAAAAARLTAWFVALSNADIFFPSKERTPRAGEQVLR